jgi:cytochrome c oxidase assembly factor CtaG
MISHRPRSRCRAVDRHGVWPGQRAGALRLAALLVPLLEVRGAAAHEVSAWTATQSAPLDWSYEPWVVLPLCLVGLFWALGLVRLARRSRAGEAAVSWRNLAFAAGWLALALSLASPLHAAGGISFTAHMIEHELLILLAAPLLVLARPAGVLLWGLPSRWRRGVAHALAGGWRGGLWRGASGPVVATSVHAALLWLWHLPVLFDAAVRDEALHALQHLSFFGSALLFWWSMFHVCRRRHGYGTAVLAVFATAVHSTLLGALLTVLPAARYPAYSGGFGLSALEDQQLAGLVMWVPAGVTYAGVGLLLFALWVGGGRGAAQRKVRVLAPG